MWEDAIGGHSYSANTQSMPTPIETNALKVVTVLFEADKGKGASFDADTLKDATQLSPRDLNDAVEYLDSQGMLERMDYMGTGPYEFGMVGLNTHGRQFYHKTKGKAKAPAKTSRAKASKREGIRVFISHSSKDVEVAKEVIQLLHTALGLKAADIRCTSVDGYRLPAGASTDEQLKVEIFDSKVFIGLVSTESMRSHYTLFELGARWGAGRKMVPLLIDSEGSKMLQGPLKGINALDAYQEAQLLQLVSEVGKELKITPDNASAYLSLIKRLIGALPNASAKAKATAVEVERVITEGADDYSNADQIIKEHCAAEWPDDFFMQKSSIEQQRQAVLKLKKGRPADISENEFSVIRKKAALDWPKDFFMRASQEQQQFEALRSLRE
ncbi:MAG: toll/interleukin-1 receptor domain-containing protein [Hymenobacter sp.]|nr:MAG: toll/interleukin-1 receptor domain-containing protein [Hymenobacter sp.]